MGEPASESTPVWPWVLVLIALAVVGGVTWWLVGPRRRRSTWRAEYATALTKIGWLIDQPVSAVVRAPSAEAMEEASRDTAVAIGEVDRQLFALQDSASDDVARQQLADARSALDELHTSLASLVERVRSGDSAEMQRQAMVEVEVARTALREITAADG